MTRPRLSDLLNDQQDGVGGAEAGGEEGVKDGEEKVLEGDAMAVGEEKVDDGKEEEVSLGSYGLIEVQVQLAEVVQGVFACGRRFRNDSMGLSRTCVIISSKGGFCYTSGLRTYHIPG
jgi:hypothetical protein